MGNTFSSYSFGCRVNQAEREVLDSHLVNLGFIKSDETPRVYIINTCAVTHKAEREAKQLIYQIRREHPDTKIVVTGCAATNWIKQKKKPDEVDVLIDNNQKEYVASLVAEKYGWSATRKSPDIKTQPQISRDKFTKSGRLFIKIQDGCQRFCSFCIVPYLRGLPSSRSPEDIISQINSDPGLKEAILVAINTEAYGYDTKTSFIDLVKRVLSDTTVPRLSFGSVHPWSVDDKFIEWYKNERENDRVVKFFHVPLQSGSDKILNLMKRGYTTKEHKERLQNIYDIDPFTLIGTDVIVGYLEETDKDFADTYQFLEESPISKFHVFRFSKRTHTAAQYMAKRMNEPTPQEKSKRSKALIRLGERKYETFLQKHVGKAFPALLLDRIKNGHRYALLHNQVPVWVKDTDTDAKQIKHVRINTYKNGALFGTIT